MWQTWDFMANFVADFFSGAVWFVADFWQSCGRLFSGAVWFVAEMADFCRKSVIFLKNI
jgi:hypothetical protein